jgi:hypothetical protein
MKAIECVWKLFDDPSTRKKSEVMGKWDIIADDSRNEPEDLDQLVESFLEFGKTYKIRIEEVGEK